MELVLYFITARPKDPHSQVEHVLYFIKVWPQDPHNWVEHVEYFLQKGPMILTVRWNLFVFCYSKAPGPHIQVELVLYIITARPQDPYSHVELVYFFYNSKAPGLHR